ncbi:FadR/GntR family transcriptional regulator [Paenibacillus sp. R14(2021)]|uniref:FadR/GntR family transcriptional regulator n=1 Tax=Paenibacillus sp. R14(2021) TaxID=2859228 RepID=UPI0021580DF2|nr:FCD domain-containing protein [Paenibacillus sp. R14(2021)]
MISIRAGEGSFVNKQEMPIPSETILWLFHNELHNLKEVYAARKLIESEVYLSAARYASPAQFEHLQQLIGQLKADQPDGSPASFLDVLDAFDLFMGDICGNAIYAKLMQTMIHLRRETSLKLLAVPGAQESSIRSRSALLKALKSGHATEISSSIDELFTDAQRFYDALILN